MPYAVGFDRTFDRLFDYVENNANQLDYPPYNIRKDGEYNYDIEMHPSLDIIKRILKSKLQMVC